MFGQTPFFGERGGQVGDTGRILVGTNSIKLTDTVHDDAGRVLHKIEAGADLKKGDSVELSVDYERRLAIQRNHSATHLLHYALRRVLGPHVTQAGSLVSPTRLRFDFNHY
ncbi:MAG: alanine--tRNA ligase, partial [Opitutae bacterium]|nr:alanine--tRNA ligase [Opitutae bacterium]